VTSPKFEFPSYVAKIGGPAQAMKLRRMTKSTAQAWLTAMFNLTDDELNEALKLAQTDRMRPHKPIMAEFARIGTAAIWLCGASTRQLSKLQDVAPQSVAQKLGRMFKQPLSDVPRLYDQMEFWRADLMLQTWTEMATIELVVQGPYEVAKMLDSATPTTNPEDEPDVGSSISE